MSGLEGAPPDCDAVVLCNTCHEVPLPDLAKLLARLLSGHLSATGKIIIIHEMSVLTAGEKQFIMWTPQDYRRIFAGIVGTHVEVLEEKSKGVPLDTTIITRSIASDLPSDLTDLLYGRFCQHLPVKRDECLDEIDKELNQRERDYGLEEAMRQRRIAFLEAQVVNICFAEREAYKVPAGRG